MRIMSERVIKEDELEYRKGLLSGKRGILTLTDKRLYFTIKKGLISKREEILFDIPLGGIRSADAVKKWAYDSLQIRFNDKGKVRTLTFMSGSSFARTLLTTNPQFIGWAQAINESRAKLK